MKLNFYTIEVINFLNFLKIAAVAEAAKMGRPTLSHSHQKKGCSATLTPRLPGTIEPYRTPGSIPMASARPECSTGHSHVASCQTMCDSASALAKPNCCPRTVLYKSSQEARDQNTLAYPLPPPTPRRSCRAVDLHYLFCGSQSSCFSHCGSRSSCFLNADPA